MDSTPEDNTPQHTVLDNGYPSDWDDVGELWDMEGHEPYAPSTPPERSGEDAPALVLLPRNAKRAGGATEDDVRELLSRDEKGRAERTARNLNIVAAHDPAFREAYLSTFYGRALLNGRDIEDADGLRLRDKLSRVYKLEFSKTDCLDAIELHAESNKRSELQEYLNGLVWDGLSRVDVALTNLCGVRFSPYSRSVSRVFFLSAAARGLRPGCKVDTMLVLVGGQGEGKSTLTRKLFGEFSSDTAINVKDKDGLLALKGKWCVEIAELTALRGKDSEPVKAYLTSAVDSFRKPYGRHEVKMPRTCVFVGTTNTDDFLTDETGARRFMPVRVESINLAAADAERDQLWAEAVHRVKAGEPWWFSKEEAATAASVAIEHIERDVWHDAVGEYLDEVERLAEVRAEGPGVSIDEILKHLGVVSAFADRRHDKRMALCLRAHGYVSKQMKMGGEKRRRWVKG